MSELIYSELKGGAGGPPADSGILLEQFGVWSNKLGVAFDMRPPDYKYIAAVLDEERSVVAGVAGNAATDRATDLWLNVLFVRGAYECQGIGAAMMAKMIEAPQFAHAQVIQLTSSERGRSFYEHLDFYEVAPGLHMDEYTIQKAALVESINHRRERCRLASFRADPQAKVEARR